MTRKRVGILVFPDVEVLDFCGPFEVFSVTRLSEELRREEPSPFEVLLVAERPETIGTTGGMKVTPDHTIDSCPPLDILVVPGGLGVREYLLTLLLLPEVEGLLGPDATTARAPQSPMMNFTSSGVSMTLTGFTTAPVLAMA